MKQVYPITIQSGMSETGRYLLMLHEPQGNRQIPIVIGQNEAQCILLAKNPEESRKIRRPMTHQLMVQMMNIYGLTLSRVTIDRVVEGVFYATLHVTDGFNERQLDSRTTDAITLALLTGAPVYAEDKVVEECGLKAATGDNADLQPATSTLKQLEEELRRCEESENYERAAEIQQQIDKLKKQ